MDIEPISATAPHTISRAIASQDWRDVAFLHWRVDPDDVAPLLPRGVVPDMFGGSSYVGLIAFRMDRAGIGPIPSVGRWGRFTEVNVRLYGVDERGRRGVVFRSLEASRLVFVLGAVIAFALPYRWSATDESHDGATHQYTSRRHLGKGGFRLRIEADEAALVDDDASAFLTARWALFQQRGGSVLRLPNDHEPWMLHPARLLELDDELVALAGLPGVTARPPDSVLYSPGVRTRFGR